MKRQSMYLRMITASLVRRRSRMLVAMLAVTVGAMILSGLVTIYYDVPRQMGAQFRSYGANMILVPETGDLSQGAIDAAVGVIPSDKLVGVAAYHYDSVRVNGTPVVIAGGNLDATRATSPYWYVDGDWPHDSGDILVGKEEAEFFSLAPGDTVTLAYTPESVASTSDGESGGDARAAAADTTPADLTADFTVSGILDTGGNEERYLFVSAADLAALTDTAIAYDVAELSVSATADELSGYASTIDNTVDGVTAQLVKRVAESEATVLSKLQALVLIVTIIVLALTMICVATTMTAVVTERRREIGLRKALGASNRSITLEFMGEGLFLGAVGGIMGSLLGFLFAQGVSQSVFNSAISFQPLLVPITIVAAIAVTACACLMPVRNATKVDPALVLKGE